VTRGENQANEKMREGGTTGGGGYRNIKSEEFWRRSQELKASFLIFLTIANKTKQQVKNRVLRCQLEIIIDLPIGFPINNIISLCLSLAMPSSAVIAHELTK